MAKAPAYLAARLNRYRHALSRLALSFSPQAARPTLPAEQLAKAASI